MKSIQKTVTFSGILGNGLRKCNLCARNVYSLQYYFQCPQAPNKNLKALSHDSNQHSPNAQNRILWSLKLQHYPQHRVNVNTILKFQVGCTIYYWFVQSAAIETVSNPCHAFSYWPSLITASFSTITWAVRSCQRGHWLTALNPALETIT